MSIYTIDTHATRMRLEIQDEVYNQYGIYEPLDDFSAMDSDEITDTALALLEASIIKDEDMTLEDAVYIGVRSLGSIKWANYAEEFINSAKAFQK